MDITPEQFRDLFLLSSLVGGFLGCFLYHSLSLCLREISYVIFRYRVKKSAQKKFP